MPEGEKRSRGTGRVTSIGLPPSFICMKEYGKVVSIVEDHILLSIYLLVGPELLTSRKILAVVRLDEGV